MLAAPFHDADHVIVLLTFGELCWLIIVHCRVWPVEASELHSFGFSARLDVLPSSRGTLKIKQEGQKLNIFLNKRVKVKYLFE